MKRGEVWLVILLISLPRWASAQTDSLEKNGLWSDPIEIQPEFPGGYEALRKFIGARLRYPEKAALKQLEGKIFVTFTIDTTGTLSEFKAQKISSSARAFRADLSLFEREALRMVRAMPKWKPGRCCGKAATKSGFILPIVFSPQNRAYKKVR